METMTVTDAIAHVNQTFMNAIRRKDGAAASYCYTADAMVLAPGMEAVSGRKAIENFWSGFAKVGDDVKLKTKELINDGKAAYEIGQYVILAGGKELDHGKYVVIWRMESGEWKLHRDIWNTNKAA